MNAVAVAAAPAGAAHSFAVNAEVGGGVYPDDGYDDAVEEGESWVAQENQPPPTVAPVATPELPTVIAFKGFDLKWQCRGFQYAIGETFNHQGTPVRCASGGFHSCEMPLDVFSYYPPNTSRFAEVLAAGTIARPTDSNEDSKIASAVITIRAELRLPDIIKRAVRWILDRAKGNTGQGYSGHAAATGYSGHAAATGYSGHAAATGNRGHAAATGNRGHAAATGNRGHAAATGYRGHAAATGYSGHAAATGYSGHAAATGNRGHAAATGNRGHAAATGNRGHAAATGNRGHAAATGNRGHAAATGNRGVAVSIGEAGTAKAGVGGAIVLRYWSAKREAWRVRVAHVGERGIEAGKTYQLSARGKFVEVQVVSGPTNTPVPVATGTISAYKLRELSYQFQEQRSRAAQDALIAGVELAASVLAASPQLLRTASDAARVLQSDRRAWVSKIYTDLLAAIARFGGGPLDPATRWLHGAAPDLLDVLRRMCAPGRTPDQVSQDLYDAGVVIARATVGDP